MKDKRQQVPGKNHLYHLLPFLNQIFAFRRKKPTKNSILLGNIIPYFEVNLAIIKVRIPKDLP
jgi:hypothetical protein